MRTLVLVILFFFTARCAPAQAPAHFVQASGIAFTNKQLFMGGYAIGMHRVMMSASIGAGSGFDDQYVSPENVSNGKAVGQIRESQTVQPNPYPSNSYVETCNSLYSIRQVRVGFTAFFRKNDTLSRHPFTGPHFGVDALYANTTESQTVVYKSKSNETRLTFSGTHRFAEIGAASHVGWQFALCREHLYLDLRCVLPFYYPFMRDPNLNSPFTGNKWEAQIVVSYRFIKPEKKVEDGGSGKVRGGI